MPTFTRKLTRIGAPPNRVRSSFCSSARGRRIDLGMAPISPQRRDARAAQTPTIDLLEPLLDRTECAAILGVSPRTLERWDADGSGPPRYLLPRMVRYRRSDVAAWLEQRRVK